MCTKFSIIYILIGLNQQLSFRFYKSKYDLFWKQNLSTAYGQMR